MLTTTHLNLLSWLQDADYDVWLYLYNNYLVHVVNARSMKAEIHRPLQFNRMFKDLQRMPLQTWSPQNAWEQQKPHQCFLESNQGSKEICIDKCKELDIHHRKSWTKGKIVTQMLAHEDNCYD